MSETWTMLLTAIVTVALGGLLSAGWYALFKAATDNKDQRGH
ncbi:hypothetical protein [Streptomyces sp. 030-HV]